MNALLTGAHPLPAPPDMDRDGYTAPPRPGQSDDCGGAGYGCPTFTTKPTQPGHGPVSQIPTPTKTATAPPATARPSPPATATATSSASSPPILPVTGPSLGELVTGALILICLGVIAVVKSRLRPKGRHSS